MAKSDPKSIEGVRHSLAHLLAAAVRELYPGAQNAIGPAIENGFYQDFDLGKRIVSDADLPKIEQKMRELLPRWTKWTKKNVTLREVTKEFGWNKYKMELAQQFAEEKKRLTFFTCGGFVDLCKGGHVLPPSKIDPRSFKLDKVAGAYWKGSEKNPQLTRIYGLAFETKNELAEHLRMLEEAKKRDHKRLGLELDLFTFSDLVGPGLPLWTPKGTLLRNLLDDFVWELRKEKGYEKVEIPHITKKELYELSGHWAKFQDELFKIKTREGHLFAMKPMNCPHHIQIFNRKQWSYRELPQRYASTTMCYRDEQTGELSGLSRVRAFTQDDAHVFCRMSQAKEEFLKIWDIVHGFYETFGFNLRVRLSLHDPKQPEKYLGDKKTWKTAENMLREIIKTKKTDAFEGVGEAAFYGPKLDFMAKDSLGREWQVATIQLDLNMPESFALTCVNEEGQPERVAMIHAAIMGSIERFLSIAIEHYAGAFPVWLAPVQTTVLPVSQKFEKYGRKIFETLGQSGIRAEFGDPTATLGKRIREAELQKIPYVLVVGEKEEGNSSVNVRQRGPTNKSLAGEMNLKDLISRIEKEIRERSL